jgi:hypothetical protein
MIDDHGPPGAQSPPDGAGSDTQRLAGGFGDPTIPPPADTADLKEFRIRRALDVMAKLEPGLAFMFRRRADGSLGRATSVATSRRLVRSGRMDPDAAYSNAVLMLNLDTMIDRGSGGAS